MLTPNHTTPRWRPGARSLVVVLLILGTAAACGTSQLTGRADSSGTPVPTVPAGTDSATTATADATTVVTAGTTTPSTTAAEAELPGEPFEFGYPGAGDRLGVVGVAHDDVLNVRSLPGANQPVVGTLAPLALDVTTTGRLRHLPDENSVWAEIRNGAGVGWVNSYYLAYLGAADDWTSRAVEGNGGRIPTAASMEALGDIVTAPFGQHDRSEGSHTVQVTAATAGDLGEVTYDVVGLLDDAQVGWRLHVFGAPLPGGGFSLASVEAIGLCGRGVTADGACV